MLRQQPLGMRKTKIVATLGPATDSEEAIGELLAAGVNVFRLNMSHAEHEWVRRVAGLVRSQAARVEGNAALLMDLQGPAIRTGVLERPLVLEVGDRVEIRMGDAGPKMPLSTEVNYAGLAGDVSVGDTMLVDNGVLHLKVLAVDAERIECEVLTAGELGSRRHINLPGVRVNLPGLTEKDLDDLDLGIEVDFDFVAMSFVREASHVDQLRGLLEAKGCGAKIVAKVEDQEAVRNLSEIIGAADVIMIARGDLGIEVHVEELPIVQRVIAKRCAALGKRFITATHLLESMITAPAPTRAEVTDVANAVFEQADALMLSGETSVGTYPRKCVEMLDCIARRIEKSGGAGYVEEAVLDSAKMKVAKSAVVLADSLADSILLVFTSRGIMANYAAMLRPKRPIFAFSPNAAVCRSLAISRGVFAQVMEFSNDPECTIEDALAVLRGKSDVEAGQSVVILSDVLSGDPQVETILLRKA